MINKITYKDCTVCKSCVNVCKFNAINFNYIKDGFSYPVIDNDKCNKCNLCNKVCPILNDIEKKQSIKEIYAAKNLDNKTRLKSSSGGVFTVLSEFILENNGIVCGAAFDDWFKVKHILIDNKDDLEKLRGSKYVQSDTGDSYKLIKKYLNEGKKILFSGCPCQVAGLKQYLCKDYENLYTVDFICHGTPSEKIFSEYLKYISEKYNSDIKRISFRDKSNGWHQYNIKVEFQNGHIYQKRATEDLYMRGFLGSMYLKESCYKCKFRNFTSGSDIILADYWGSEVESKDIDDNKGLSVIIVNTSKGQRLIENVQDKIYMKDIDFERTIKYNQGLLYSPIKNKNREDFYLMANNYSYKKAFLKFCKERTIDICKRRMRSTLGYIKRGIL